MMRNKNVFVILFSLLLGSLIGVFLCNYTFFEYDYKVSLFDVFSLFLTTGVGFYIALIITKSINSNSAEKQLLISELY
jgi:positive regulator of sigma E activity